IGGGKKSSARSTISIARTTPAQKPRGFARITFLISINIPGLLRTTAFETRAITAAKYSNWVSLLQTCNLVRHQQSVLNLLPGCLEVEVAIDLGIVTHSARGIYVRDASVTFCRLRNMTAAWTV